MFKTTYIPVCKNQISMISILFIYSLISFLILFLVSKFSYKFDLVDIPNKRKIHSKPIAYTGGVALCLIYILATFLFNFSSQKLDLILSAAFLVAIVGFIDDKYILNVGGKLSLQIIPVIYLILFYKFNLNEIGNYDYFTIQLHSFSIPFTLLSIVILINSFNYFDGLDGTLAFVSLSTLSILFFLTYNDKDSFEFFLIIISIPLIIFLFFNFSKFGLPKLFLGDSGSLLLGFIISFTIIYIVNQNKIHPILLAFSISIFVYEFLSINLIRILKKKKLFKSGQDHLHHILLKKNKSILLTNFLISIMNIIYNV